MIEKFSNTTEDVWKIILKIQINLKKILELFWENFGKIKEKEQGNCKNTTAIILRISDKTAEKHCCKLRETLL